MKSLLKKQLLSAFLLTGALSLSTSLSLGQNTNAATPKNSGLSITSIGELISDRRSDDNNRGRSSDDNYNGDRGRGRNDNNRGDRGRGRDDNNNRGRSSDDNYNRDRGRGRDDNNRGRSSDDNYNGDRGRGRDNNNRGRSSDDNYNGDRGRGRDDSNTSTRQLPARIANAVVIDLSRQTRISARELQVTQYRRQKWSDGCLGLAKPGEICTQAVVDGWRIVVSNGQRDWVYRTNRNGQVLRLENRNTANNSNNLPRNIANRVLRDAAQKLNVSSSQLKLVKAERRNWSDGCLGLGRPEYQCAAAITPGWLVTVEGRQQRLVYRTGDAGGAIALDNAASSVVDNGNKPIQIPTSELPPVLERGAIFRAISSGGFALRTYETTLFNDGRVVSVLVNNSNDSQPQTYQISRQQVRQFRQLLQRQQFNQFDRLSYPVSQGAADFINITLSSRTATTSYTDANQNNLPRPLKAVIAAWNQIASNTQ